MKIKLFTVPNIITLLNLLCGCAAAVSALGGDLTGAFWLVIAAAVLDFLDGMAARLLGQYSPVGKQLDSLADMVSFGFVPGAVLFVMAMWSGVSMYAALPLFLVTAFSALRLAKVNIDESQTEEFVGMPTPASTLVAVSLGYLYAAGTLSPAPWAIYLVAAALCWLMVCNIRMFSLKFHGFGWRGNELRYVFMLCSAVALAILGIAAIPPIMAAYVLTSVARNLLCRGA